MESARHLAARKIRESYGQSALHLLLRSQTENCCGPDQVRGRLRAARYNPRMANTSPMLYQINTRLTLGRLGRQLDRRATLDDLPQTELERLAGLGFDWIYLLGIWKTGARGKRLAQQHAGWFDGLATELPGLQRQDICASCFAITGYQISPALGGERALSRLRQRMHKLGLRLMLDFIPNHTAVDHPWARQHPEYYIAATPQDLKTRRYGFARVQTVHGRMALAHGRDPYFPPWNDTLQLNYAEPALQAAMQAKLLQAAGLCDGLRVDMAMLALPEVFERTWGRQAQPFWPGAIAALRQAHPGFTLLAEVYWDLEAALLEQGFDYAYDKRLYDRLAAGQAEALRLHLGAYPPFQAHLARFLENHDEPRAAAVFPPERLPAAAALTYLSPGLRFFHQGQLQGARLKLPVQLCYAPEEPPDPAVAAFYQRLLPVLRHPALQDGGWRLADGLDEAPGEQPVTPPEEPASASAAQPAGQPTGAGILAGAWESPTGERLLTVVNYSPSPGQRRLRLPFSGLPGGHWRFSDLLSPAALERPGDELAAQGLLVRLPGWGVQVYEVKRITRHRNQQLLEQLNAAYSDAPGAEEHLLMQ